MILVVDVGNTHTKFALFKRNNNADAPLVCWHMMTDKNYTVDKFATLCLKTFKEHQIDSRDIKGAAISSVVERLTPVLKQFFERFFMCTPIVINEPGTIHQVTTKVEQPATLGADILADTVAANKLYGGSAIIVDLGTATTFIVTDKKGCLIGGAIAPGLKLVKDALVQKADLLPDIDLLPPEKTIATNTIDAMRSGIFLGYIDLLNGMIARFIAEFKAPLKVIIVGGFSKFVYPHLKESAILDPELTLKGIYYVYLMNEHRVQSPEVIEKTAS